MERHVIGSGMTMNASNETDTFQRNHRAGVFLLLILCLGWVGCGGEDNPSAGPAGGPEVMPEIQNPVILPNVNLGDAAKALSFAEKTFKDQLARAKEMEQRGELAAMAKKDQAMAEVPDSAASEEDREAIAEAERRIEVTYQKALSDLKAEVFQIRTQATNMLNEARKVASEAGVQVQ